MSATLTNVEMNSAGEENDQCIERWISLLIQVYFLDLEMPGEVESELKYCSVYIFYNLLSYEQPKRYSCPDV